MSFVVVWAFVSRKKKKTIALKARPKGVRWARQFLFPSVLFCLFVRSMWTQTRNIRCSGDRSRPAGTEWWAKIQQTHHLLDIQEGKGCPHLAATTRSRATEPHVGTPTDRLFSPEMTSRHIRVQPAAVVSKNRHLYFNTSHTQRTQPYDRGPKMAQVSFFPSFPP